MYGEAQRCWTMLTMLNPNVRSAQLACIAVKLPLSDGWVLTSPDVCWFIGTHHVWTSCLRIHRCHSLQLGLKERFHVWPEEWHTFQLYNVCCCSKLFVEKHYWTIILVDRTHGDEVAAAFNRIFTCRISQQFPKVLVYLIDPVVWCCSSIGFFFF